MSQNPKLELKANQPQLLTLKSSKPFAEGVNKFGKWFGWNVLIDGLEHTFFTDETVNSAFLTAGKAGSKFNVTLKFNGKTPSYVVQEALFDDKGVRVDQPQSVQEPSPAREAYRANRVERLVAAIIDVKVALSQSSETATPDLIQKYATSLLIEEQKRG